MQVTDMPCLMPAIRACDFLAQNHLFETQTPDHHEHMCKAATLAAAHRHVRTAQALPIPSHAHTTWLVLEVTLLADGSMGSRHALCRMQGCSGATAGVQHARQRHGPVSGGQPAGSAPSPDRAQPCHRCAGCFQPSCTAPHSSVAASGDAGPQLSLQISAEIVAGPAFASCECEWVICHDLGMLAPDGRPCTCLIQVLLMLLSEIHQTAAWRLRQAAPNPKLL